MGCNNINVQHRYSRCINMYDRTPLYNLSINCCSKVGGQWLELQGLCNNDQKSTYGVCCMSEFNVEKHIFSSIWTNYTMVNGIMLFTNEQVQCAGNPNDVD